MKKLRNQKRKIPHSFIYLVCAVWLAGCMSPPDTPQPTASEEVGLTIYFPSAGAVAGWDPEGVLETFDADTIFNLVDGQADTFFAYGFQQVAVQSYTDGAGNTIGVEIWQLATPGDAYGLFSHNIAGDPLAIGNEADHDPGRRIAFWQDHFYVHVRARQDVDDAGLQALAQAVAGQLPTGGERPALMDRLPAEGLVERSAFLFHQEISIQNDLWLGGTNLLGLSAETDGVLAEYTIDGAPAQLLVVVYPDAQSAQAAYDALIQSEFAPLAGQVQDTSLGAVFGEVNPVAAASLLEAALE